MDIILNEPYLILDMVYLLLKVRLTGIPTSMVLIFTLCFFFVKGVVVVRHLPRGYPTAHSVRQGLGPGRTCKTDPYGSCVQGSPTMNPVESPNKTLYVGVPYSVTEEYSTSRLTEDK